MDELNPGHRVTASMHDHWHKIVALLMLKFDLGHVVITKADFEEFSRQCPDHAVMINDKRDGIHLKIVSREEGERLAREEGGVPS